MEDVQMELVLQYTPLEASVLAAAYLLLQYAPPTIIFLTITLFRVSLVSPPMAHYVLYCNFVLANYGTLWPIC